MSKIINSIRVFTNLWLEEEAFASLLSELASCRDWLDQVALFTSSFHPPMPLETAKQHCEILKDRVARIRALGFSCGLNILDTLGHHPERMDEALQGSWTCMTNSDGEICPGSRCMNDPAYREQYLRPLYRLHCDVHPDFIWIDDDIRYGHLPVGFCCFCDNCLRKFNAAFHHDFDRPALKAALENPDNVALRKEWLLHQSDNITGLLRFLRQVVDESDSSIMLGLMTGDRYFEGYDFAAWADALSDGGKHAIMWRPGGGAYVDQPFTEQMEKASAIGRQCANLPAYVTEIQSEMENFPYRVLRKSPRSTALEALMHLSTGCTGTALNILPNGDEPLEVIRPHLEEIRRTTPFMRRLNAVMGRRASAGIYDGWHIHSQAAVPGSFVHGNPDNFTLPWQELYSLGLPESFDFDKAACYVLTGRVPYAFEKKEIETMLSRGVYLDAGAVIALQELGYGELVGFTVGEIFPEDSAEVYTDHPLNEGFAGHRRLCPQIFCTGGSAALLPDPSAEILCRLEDFHGRTQAPCSMGLFRNRLGGLVCASSHYAASELSDSMKSRQMKRLFRRLSGDTLPVLAESYVRMRFFSRPDAAHHAATLLNINLDRLTDVSVLLSGHLDRAVLTDESCRETVLTPAGIDGGMTRFVIPEMAPYSMYLLTADRK